MIMKTLPYQLVLASASPRRAQLLKDAGFEFEVRVSHVDEVYPNDLKVNEIPLFLSKLKVASLVGGLATNELVIAADTIVHLHGNVLNKPLNRDEASLMLQKLAGQKHEVITGVTLATTSKSISFYDVTEVYFKKLSASQIDFYIDHFKPYDKAGAYGIQEWIGMVGVEKINGSFYNVMGLPIHKVFEELQLF
jgi:septum formation protein